MREPLQNIQLIRDSLALYAKFFAPFTLLAIVPLALEVFVRLTLFSDLLTVNPGQEVIARLFQVENALLCHISRYYRRLPAQ